MTCPIITKHIISSQKFATELSTILKPLFDYSEVRYFSYNRYFRNQTWSGLYSDTTAVEIELAKGGGPLFVDRQGICIPSGSYLHKDVHELLKISVDNKQVERFFSQEGNPMGKKVVQNGLLLIRKGMHYDESFYFSMLDTVLSDRPYYYCIINDLKNFSLYFLEKGKKIIEYANTKIIKYNIPKASDNLFFSIFTKHDDDKGIASPNKFCFSTTYGDVFLSRQELNCLRHIAMNKSQESISQELGLSRRTVESYLLNLKNKLNVDSKEELTAYYKAFSVMDSSQV